MITHNLRLSIKKLINYMGSSHSDAVANKTRRLITQYICYATVETRIEKQERFKQTIKKITQKNLTWFTINVIATSTGTENKLSL